MCRTWTRGDNVFWKPNATRTVHFPLSFLLFFFLVKDTSTYPPGGVKINFSEDIWDRFVFVREYRIFSTRDFVFEISYFPSRGDEIQGIFHRGCIIQICRLSTRNALSSLIKNSSIFSRVGSFLVN